jgi:CspA family cold shock protein
MATGTVKWFNNQKGYGFICAADSDEEIFAHFSSIVMEGYKSLKAGQPVDFEVNPGPKGLHALNIRPAGMPIPESAKTAEG